MAATGRKPNTSGLGLAEAGVELDDAGAVRVNDDRQTSVPSIYALGDVTNRINLTPVATGEGHALADTLYGGNRRINLNDVPTVSPAAYCDSRDNRNRSCCIRVSLRYLQAHFRAMKNTISGRQEKTLMKLIVASDSDKVIGAHMLGPDAPEIIQGIGIAIKAGATKAGLTQPSVFPTAAEEFVTMRQPVRQGKASICTRSILFIRCQISHSRYHSDLTNFWSTNNELDIIFMARTPDRSGSDYLTRRY